MSIDCTSTARTPFDTSGRHRSAPRLSTVQGTGLPFAQGVADAGYNAVPAMTQVIATGIRPRGAPR